MIEIRRKEIFIPEVDGNEKTEKPVKFHLRYLTSYEYYAALSKIDGKLKQDTSELILKSVTKIENMTVRDESGTTTDITTAEQFVECPDIFDWYSAVAGRIINMHLGIDKKK